MAMTFTLSGWRRTAAISAAGSLALALAAAMALGAGFSLASTAFVFLMIVVAIALYADMAIALFFAAVAALALNVLFAEPRFSLAVLHPRDGWILLAFVLTAAFVSTAFHGVRANARSEMARERRAGELARVSQAAYLAEAQRLSRTGSYGWNLSTGEVTWSEETYRICGIDPAAPLSIDIITRHVHDEDRAAFVAAVEGAIRARGAFDHELRFVRDDGDTRILHMLGHFLPEQRDQFVGALSDVTERRANEAALRTSEFRYRSMFRAMAASFWDLDFNDVTPILRRLRKEGVADYDAFLSANPAVVREMMRATRVLDVNDQTVALFGLGEKAVLLGNVEPFFPDSAVGVFARSICASIRREVSYSEETRLRRIDGTEFEALFTVCFPQEGFAGGGRFLVGVIDISERVSAQEELRRLQTEFAHAARLMMLGELAASIAHEVNQPLAAIATNASAGLRWLNRPEPDLDEVRALATRIESDARRAGDIIQRIRGMAMHKVSERAPLMLGAAIEEAVAFLRHDLQAHRVSIRITAAATMPPVRADRTQIQQVIVNLALNAAQAMAAISERERTITISATHDDAVATVTVDDSGPGLPDASADRLFQSFVTTKYGGMGIGLPICRSIVESHGGRIRAENRAEGGARFSFTLPLLATEISAGQVSVTGT